MSNDPEIPGSAALPANPAPAAVAEAPTPSQPAPATPAPAAPAAATSANESWLRGPWPNVLSLLIGAVSLIAGVFFYLASQSTRELLFYRNPLDTIVVQAGQASRLTTSFDGKPVTTDITATQFQVYAGGNQAIRPEHVLEPVWLKTAADVPILEATIAQARRAVSGVALDTHDLEHGRVGVTWKILEPGDGALIQLVYPGKPYSTRVDAIGTVEGQPDGIRQLSGSVSQQFTKSGPTTKSSYVIYALMSGIPGCLMLWGFIAAIRSPQNRAKRLKDTFGGYLVLGLFICVLFSIAFYCAKGAVIGSNTPPPFGP